MFRKNAFIVMDTETSAYNGLVFDFGWTKNSKQKEHGLDRGGVRI